ncbi:MAG: hypothetical protein RJA22_1018 [Verrucomicrobiota bacterium]|jgi:arylsulfatase
MRWPRGRAVPFFRAIGDIRLPRKGMRCLLLPLLAALAALHPPDAVAAPAGPARPNLIVILSDDVGYSDLGCYGGEIPTPNLDALAAGGLRFTQFYNTARCCPTRASLLTGLHPHQAGIGHMMEDRGHPGYRGTLNRSCVTIAEALKPAGYRSYAVGKWHVTPGHTAKSLEDRSNWPLQRGFERYYGTIHGAGSFFDPSSLLRDNTPITVANDPVYRPRDYYYTDAIADHAVTFVREHARAHRGQPFFLYTAFTAAHWPMHAREADIARQRGRYREGYAAVAAARWRRQKEMGLVHPGWIPAPVVGDWSQVPDRAFEERCMEVYAAMLESMDQGIGRLVAELKAQGMLDNTLILYLQDNGACAENTGRGPNATARADKPTLPPMGPDDPQYSSQPKQTRDGWPVRSGRGVMPGGPDTYVAYGREWATVSNTPFREYKHWTHEGGISTPLIAHWPAGMAAARRGKLEAQPGQLVDIMATCMDLAGAAYPQQHAGQAITPLEGTSLRPAFEGRDLGRTRPLVWEHEGNRAIRDGRWKLVAMENKPWELYDLEADRGEQRDLSAAEPARVKAMAAAWEAWAARANVLPLGTWKGRPAGNTAAPKGGAATRFELKAGDRLEAAEAPAIAGRGFRATVNFEAGPAAQGVLLAQGGSNLGYALYAGGGRLHAVVRNRQGKAEASLPLGAGAHRAVLRMEASGALSLTLGPATEPARAALPGGIGSMPADGLSVGSDEGGRVGPYGEENRFNGTLGAVRVELDAP